MHSQYFVKCAKGHVFVAKPGSALEKKCQKEYPDEIIIGKVLISKNDCPKCNPIGKSGFGGQLYGFY